MGKAVRACIVGNIHYACDTSGTAMVLLSGAGLFCSVKYSGSPLYEDIDGSRLSGSDTGSGLLWMGRPADPAGV